MQSGQTVVYFAPGEKRDGEQLPPEFKAYYYDDKREIISEYNEAITNDKLNLMYNHINGPSNERDAKKRRDYLWKNDMKSSRLSDDQDFIQKQLKDIQDEITQLENKIKTETDQEKVIELENALSEKKAKEEELKKLQISLPHDDCRWRKQFMITLTAERKKNTQVLQQTQTQAGTGR